MNMAGMVSTGTFVLFAQEVLHIGAGLFAVVMMGGAVGGVIGGAFASAVLSKRFGSGTCLAVVLLVSVAHRVRDGGEPRGGRWRSSCSG